MAKGEENIKTRQVEGPPDASQHVLKRNDSNWHKWAPTPMPTQFCAVLGGY